MKYKKRSSCNIDYTKEYFQPCWTCKKACGGCCWSRSFKPVPGWVAEENFLPSNGEFAKTYKIISCPEYEKEKRGK